MKSIIYLLVAITLASCGKFSDGTSVWAEGGFLLFWIPFIGSLIFLWSAYRSSKSGSLTGGSSSDPVIKEHKENVSIYKTWQFKFFVVLQLASWVVVFVQNYNK